MIIYNSSNIPILDIEVDDSSYRYRALMRSDELTLMFSLAEHVELPLGAWCDFGGKYELMSLSNVTVHHRRNYEYRVVMYSAMERTKNYVIYNDVDHRLKFDLTATPYEHLAMVVANLNDRESGWSIGSYINAEPHTIGYNHTTCWDAIVQIANTFGTEFEISGKTISLGKVEYYRSDPLELGYGKGNGLRPGVNRISSSMPIGSVYVQGGSRNISLENYDAPTLHLPQGYSFYFNGDFCGQGAGPRMSTDLYGTCVSLWNAPPGATELSLDLSDFYPKREGVVSGVVYEYRKNYYTSVDAMVAVYPDLATNDEEWQHVFIHFYDSTIPNDLNYEECLMGTGQPLTVIFQSGELVGREFNVTFHKQALTKKIEEEGQEGYVILIPENRFEIELATIDGVDMPSRLYRPSSGDEYAIFNCSLPQSYINSGSVSKQGAEWDMLREAANFLYENSEPQVAYKGDLDPIYAKQNWLNIGSKLQCGCIISFSDPAVQVEPIEVRIVGIRQYVNNPYAPTIEFSNELVSPTLTSKLSEIKAQESKVESMVASANRYTGRSWHNAKETAEMLIKAALEGFSEAINPIAVQTMQMIAGAEYLQFYFIRSVNDGTRVPDTINYDPGDRVLTVENSVIRHMTLGIDKITSQEGRPLSDYKIWTLNAWRSAELVTPDKAYYFYAYVPAENGVGSWILTDTERPFKVMEEQVVDGQTVTVVTHYNLLVGILNSEEDYDRSFARLYGFTEILPGQVTTDRIISADGQSYFDFVANRMRFGDAQGHSFSWNQPIGGRPSHQFRISGGTLIQTLNPDTDYAFPMTCFRGNYSSSATYYFGDEVNYVDGCSYVYVNESAPSTGRTPSDDGIYWKVKNTAGSSAQLISIVASAQVFIYDNVDDAAPSGDTSITLTAITQNIATTTYVWYRWTGSTWTVISGQTSDTLTVSYNDAGFNASPAHNVAKFRVEPTGDSSLYDEMSLYKVYGGTDGISVFLTNENHTFPASETAAAASSTTTEVIVFRGAHQLTCGNDFSSNNTDFTINAVTNGGGGSLPTGMSAIIDNTTGAITFSVDTRLNTNGEADVYVWIKAENGDSTVVISGTTYHYTEAKKVFSWSLSRPGAKGDPGKKLRGPIYWEPDKPYESGENGEFQDLVYYAGGIFACLRDHVSSDQLTPTTATVPPTWAAFSQMDYVATKVIFAKKGKIENLVVDSLFTEETVRVSGSDTVISPISIYDNVISIIDTDPSSPTFGEEKLKITSDELPTSEPQTPPSSTSSASTTLSFNVPTTWFANVDEDLVVGSITVTQANNSVTLPTITLSVGSLPAGTGATLYYSVMIGNKYLESGNLASGTVGGGEVSLPVGTHVYKVGISGGFYSTDEESTGYKSLTVSARGDGAITVAYTNRYAIIATNGMQLRFGDEGFRAAEGEGTKVIQDGYEYESAGIGSIESGLDAPRRFIFCYDYPDEYGGDLDDDAVYIKVAPSNS